MSTVTNYYQCCGHCGVDEPYNCGEHHLLPCGVEGCNQGHHVIKTVTKSDDGKKTKGTTFAPYKESALKPRYGRCCGDCYEDPECECNMWEDCECVKPVMCENCDGIKCMDCRLRNWHEKCEYDCPDCCAPSPPAPQSGTYSLRGVQKGSIRLKGSWSDPFAFTPDFLGIPDPPPQPNLPDQPAPPLSADRQALLDELMGKPANDPVNHPRHYTDHPSGVECIQITEWMGFNLGNAVKYIWRADLKGNDIQDLEKSRWYLDREIARRKRALDVQGA